MGAYKTLRKHVIFCCAQLTRQDDNSFCADSCVCVCVRARARVVSRAVDAARCHHVPHGHHGPGRRQESPHHRILCICGKATQWRVSRARLRCTKCLVCHAHMRVRWTKRHSCASCSLACALLATLHICAATSRAAREILSILGLRWCTQSKRVHV
jgi:hypothetical protein